MDGKDITTSGDANWRAACESEARTRDNWQDRWGWIRDEYRTLTKELDELKVSCLKLALALTREDLFVCSCLGQVPSYWTQKVNNI